MNIDGVRGPCPILSHRKRRAYARVSLLLTFAAASGMPFAVAPRACAADAAPATGTATLEEITVTATRVSENVQNVPMSITPITASTLQQAGVTDFQDYAHMVPNLTFSHSYGVEGADVAIRGIQGNGTVAFYVDDLAIDESMDPRLLDDVQRIEVLEGPQGTLFGARSMGGAVHIITQTPDTQKWSGAVNVQGTDSDPGRPGFQMDGYVNIPLIADTLALRISAFDGSTGPFIKRQWLADPTPALLSSLAGTTLTPSELSHYPLDSTLTARDNYRGGMASLLWTPADKLSVRAVFMNQVSNYNGWPVSDFEVTPTTSDYTANSLSQIRTFDIPEWEENSWWLAGVTVKYRTSIGELTSATGYVHETSDNYEDVTEWTNNVIFPGLTPQPAPILSWNYSHSFSEELRFASNPLGPFQFVSGIYVLRDSGVNGQNWAEPNFASYMVQDGYPPPYTNVGYYSNGLSQDFEDAVYGNLTYHVTSKLSITGGYRESHVFSTDYTPWSGFLVAGTSGGGGADVENVSTPKVSVQYQATPDVMYYALASKGFRPGGGQVAPPPDGCAQDYVNEGLTPGDLSKIGPDWLWNYEVGAKTESFDHRLLVNVDGYQINWSNIQQQSRFPICGFTFDVNAGAARSRGAELTVAVAPLQGLQLSASVGYENAVLTESSATAGLPVGTPVQQVAPWTAAASAQYTYPITGFWNGLLRMDYNYTDHSFSANNPPYLRLRPSYNLANVHAGVESDQWRFEAFVDNATNAHPNLGDSSSEAGEDPGRPRINTMTPRTYGIQVGYRF